MSPDPQDETQLQACRAAITQVDADLVRLIAKRTRLAVEAGLLKHQRGQPLHDAVQEDVVRQRAVALGAELGLDGDGVAAVFAALLQLARAAQRASLAHRP